MDNLTPMMRQYHRLKQEHAGALLFFRLGDFYEMFYEDALIGSRELDITLTSRGNDRQGNPIPMCGIPYHAAANYLNRLLKKGFKVALCEQVEDPKQAQGIVRREVTRILTPGTAVEEGILESRENNYLASIVTEEESVSASFLDVSTGEFWVTEFPGADGPEKLAEQLLHFRPSEMVVPEYRLESFSKTLPQALVAGSVVTGQPDWTFNPDYARRMLLEQFHVSGLDGFGLEGRPRSVASAGALIRYVRHTQKSSLEHINTLRLLESADFLKMDGATVQVLELVRGSDGNRRWTLLSTLDQTRTGMGARMLRSWILRPSLRLEEIEARLDAVEELQGSVVAMNSLGKLLAAVHDMERLVSRITMERAGPRDLLALGDSIRVLPELAEHLKRYQSRLLQPDLDLLSDVLDCIERAIDPQAPAHCNDGGIMRDGFSSELDELRTIARSGKSYIAGLEARERENTGIGSLKIKFNKVFGYFIEVTKTHLDSVPDHYIRKQTLASSERYITPELKEYEDKVLGAEERTLQIEKDLFLDVRARLGRQAARIQKSARFVARTDTLLALAEVAHKYRYCRPRLDESTELRIRAGRHPVLELQGERPFVPNDLTVNTSSDQLLILTGPNMGGKSTFLRQNALIVVLAQMGSFVPAEDVQVGLVDQIFTRVGASDNLSRGQSTFMIEMIETARILNTATCRSFILLDEVGRGTATFDGLSIAWSVAEFLIQEKSRKARTLFATHYQELTRLEKVHEGVKNYCVTVREAGNSILFFHRVMPGVADKSYGIEVARLAGIPPRVLSRAREILTRLEKKQLNLSGHPRVSQAETEVFRELQQTLF